MQTLQDYQCLMAFSSAIPHQVAIFSAALRALRIYGSSFSDLAFIPSTNRDSTKGLSIGHAGQACSSRRLFRQFGGLADGDWHRVIAVFAATISAPPPTAVRNVEQFRATNETVSS